METTDTHQSRPSIFVKATHGGKSTFEKLAVWKKRSKSNPAYLNEAIESDDERKHHKKTSIDKKTSDDEEVKVVLRAKSLTHLSAQNEGTQQNRYSVIEEGELRRQQHKKQQQQTGPYTDSVKRSAILTTANKCEKEELFDPSMVFETSYRCYYYNSQKCIRRGKLFVAKNELLFKCSGMPFVKAHLRYDQIKVIETLKSYENVKHRVISIKSNSGDEHIFYKFIFPTKFVLMCIKSLIKKSNKYVKPTIIIDDHVVDMENDDHNNIIQHATIKLCQLGAKLGHDRCSISSKMSKNESDENLKNKVKQQQQQQSSSNGSDSSLKKDKNHRPKHLSLPTPIDLATSIKAATPTELTSKSSSNSLTQKTLQGPVDSNAKLATPTQSTTEKSNTNANATTTTTTNSQTKIPTSFEQANQLKHRKQSSIDRSTEIKPLDTFKARPLEITNGSFKAKVTFLLFVVMLIFLLRNIFKLRELELEMSTYSR